MSIDKKPFGISNFGISSIILFFLAFGIDIREKNTSNVTTTLLIVGGALIGTTALGVSAMDKTRIGSNIFDSKCNRIRNNGTWYTESYTTEEVYNQNCLK